MLSSQVLNQRMSKNALFKKIVAKF